MRQPMFKPASELLGESDDELRPDNYFHGWTYKDGFIEHPSRPDYYVDVRTAAKSSGAELVDWINHLSEKPWVTGDMMLGFVRIIRKRFGRNWAFRKGNQ